MKKKIFSYIAVGLAFLLIAVVGSDASEVFFANDSDGILPQMFDGVYAIGANGTSALPEGTLYALTSDGMQKLGVSGSMNGGGGLLYDNGTVGIRDDKVKVALNYYYSAYRDSSVSSARLRNDGGDGFSFGYQKENGTYAELESTAATDITLFPSGSTGITAYSGGKELFTMGVTGRDLYLMICPIASDKPTEYNGRSYFGDFCAADLGNGKLTIVNYVDLENYVKGVCSCEMSESWPLEALKAQAVAARTYAQRLIHSSVYFYSYGYDLTGDTYCQAYLGSGSVGSRIERAADETENQYLTVQNSLADALYFSSDGGATENSINVFGTATEHLIGIFDPYEAASDDLNPYSDWEVTLTPAQLGKKVGIGAVRNVTTTFSETGNVIKLEFVSDTGQTATVIRDSCRTVLGLKSLRYEISKDSSGNYLFSGHGFGHNLGMSQWGAYSMAKYYDKDYKEILGFYYTKSGLSFGKKS